MSINNILMLMAACIVVIILCMIVLVIALKEEKKKTTNLCNILSKSFKEQSDNFYDIATLIEELKKQYDTLINRLLGLSSHELDDELEYYDRSIDQIINGLNKSKYLISRTSLKNLFKNKEE